MKILITSDWHLDAVTAGVSRNSDVVGGIRWTVERAIEEHVDLYVFLGDLCDPDANRAPWCVSRAIETAGELQRKGIESRWLVGNHDVIEDGSGSSTMEPIRAAGFHLRARPSSEVVNGVHFIWLPFTPRVDTYDPAEFVRGCDVALGVPVLVLGHLNVPGVVPGSETQELPRGRDVWFPVDAVRERWGTRATMINGHYHRLDVNNEVLIPGSLERLTFGEAGHTPGCLVLEIG